jgi:hypothetical protein
MFINIVEFDQQTKKKQTLAQWPIELGMGDERRNYICVDYNWIEFVYRTVFRVLWFNNKTNSLCIETFFDDYDKPLIRFETISRTNWLCVRSSFRMMDGNIYLELS